MQKPQNKKQYHTISHEGTADLSDGQYLKGTKIRMPQKFHFPITSENSVQVDN